MTASTSTSSNSLWAKWRGLELWTKILLGMIAGLAAGALMGEGALIFKPLGSLFVNAIKMLIVPLVFCSLIVGITSMEDSRKMGRIGLKSLIIYLSTTAVAISIGLALGHFLAPGEGMNLIANTDQAAKEAPTLVQTIIGLIPSNPVEALASGNILQIIVFAVALGLSLNMIGEKGKPAVALFESLSEAMYKLTGIIMGFAPIGVFGLMAWVAGSYGLDVLMPLIKVVAAVYLGCALHIYGFYSFMLSAFGRLNPMKFFRGIRSAQSIAFTTSSSAGSLPASLSSAQNNLGVSKGISSFVLPLGATINMDGTALYQGVTALFVAQAFGIDLAMSDYMTIIITATLASVGTAGVPGAGLIMLSLVLTTVGLPMEGVALIAGIDRVLDMARTMVNVSGDLMVTTVVGRSENEIDLDTYNSDTVISVATKEAA